MATILNPFTNDLEELQWYSMADTAKKIGKNMGRTKLYRFLREQGVIQGKKGKEPRFDLIHLKYFRVVDKITRRDYGYETDKVLLVSQLGVKYIESLLAAASDVKQKNPGNADDH